jgi:uncharacterized RDD family membrane protein YckC
VVFVEPPDSVSDAALESAGEAHAVPAGVAIAVPMPRATANAPIRPTYLLYPIVLTAMSVAPYSAFERSLGDTSKTLMGVATRVADTVSLRVKSHSC